MKLLIVTQKVDTNDPVLGFFHRWIEEFAKYFEHIHVICLFEGKHNLPQNVQIHSLGKEKGRGRITYIFRFYKYIWRLRKEYDSVFVHMNQEYVLLGGLFWRFTGKVLYMWRNHYSGSLLTDISVLFCTKLFCTSTHSYIARYKKNVLMPVGVDTKKFYPRDVVREKNTILYVGRVVESKKVEDLIGALNILKQRDVHFNASLYGGFKDSAYRSYLEKRIEDFDLKDRITLKGEISNSDLPDIYNAYEIFVNTSPSGMYDKTIFEALACGCITLARSKDFGKETDGAFSFESESELASLIERCLKDSDNIEQQNVLARYIRKNTLSMLGAQLAKEII